MHTKIKELSSKRIKYLIEKQIPFYEWNKTYLKWLREELEEVEEEPVKVTKSLEEAFDNYETFNPEGDETDVPF